MQACLREIHASILRKHLHRLEHPDSIEQDKESEDEIDAKEKDATHIDDDDDDDEGLVLFLYFRSLKYSLPCCNSSDYEFLYLLYV